MKYKKARYGDMFDVVEIAMLTICAFWFGVWFGGKSIMYLFIALFWDIGFWIVYHLNGKAKSEDTKA